MEIERKIAVSLPLVSRSTPTNVPNNVFPPVRPMHGRTSGPTRRSTRGQWTPEEDEVLRRAVQHYQGKNWKKIAEYFKERTDVQCLHRWQKVLNPELIKGPWSKEEDETIVQLVNKYGPKKWSTIAQHLPGRIGKQCRERWHNHLNPAINREPWTQEEELVLIRAHQLHGNKWAELTKYLPGRTDNSIKNHWNSSVKKKLDSLLSSGLLAQSQHLPLVSHQNGDESVSNGGAKEEDDFESTEVGVSQTAREISYMACQTRGGEYYMSLDDVTFTIPNLPCEFTPSPKYLDPNFSNDSETCVNANCGFDLQNMALELAMNSNNISSIYELGDTPNEYDASTLVANNMDLESELCAYEYWNPFNPLNATMVEPSQCEDLPNDNFATTLANDVANDVLPNNGHIDVTFSKQMESSKLVPIDTNGLETLDSQQTHTSTTEEEGGALCYEPPRFPPTLNIPLFSCDLTSPCSEGQQDFSPLGIRQLMMSSMSSSITPFKLWDSPSSDAELRSSFEACSCTPSILKKRRRDVLSPLSPFSERRWGRKIRCDASQGFLCTSKLTKEFSRLDAIVDDVNANKELPSTSRDQNDTAEVSIEKKDDIFSVSLKEAKEENRNSTEDEPSKVDAVNNNVESEDTFDHQSTLKAYEHCASEMPRGILVECHSNSTNFSSPSEAKHKEVSKYSEGNSDIHQNCIQFVEANKDAVSSSLMVDSLLNEVGAENLNIFGGTPFRRSIESPSAWKSPWYFNSLVPCSRFDTDIMLRDIGIFMTPGERSVDALSLMKQINEQNADAYADAKIVLGSDTPDSIMRRSCFRNQDAERTEKVNGGQSEGRLRLASNVLTECRTLDFSECGTPAKSVDKGKCRTSTSLSSPSCLLKNYR